MVSTTRTPLTETGAKQLFFDLSAGQLQELVEALGEPAYRARQVVRGVYQRAAGSFADLTDLPERLRVALEARLSLSIGDVCSELVSDDGETRKVLFRLRDGEIIETVLMHYDPRSDSRERATVCVSSQAGCAMGCVFCATGQQGFRRNLTAGEIVGQVVHFERELRPAGKRVTNVVFMGMGEPLANYSALIEAIHTLNSPDGPGLGARHITVSTVGIVRGIRALAREPVQVNLAVSLHAPDDAARQALIPTAHRYPLADILDACKEFSAITGRRVSYEYALIERKNDSLEEARRLAALLRGTNCHVNLIPVNPTANRSVRRPSRARTLAFQRELLAQGIPCTVRVEKGVEIAAACGQLRGTFDGDSGIRNDP
jgi:23S rRNA (adenine2503-C2)-methyltransferase